MYRQLLRPKFLLLNYVVLFTLCSSDILYREASCDKFLIKKFNAIIRILSCGTIFSITFNILNVGRQMWAIHNGRVAKPIRGGRKMYALIIEEKSVQ